MMTWKRRILNLLQDYGEDLLLIVFLAWLMPYIHARLLLPELFPIFHKFFSYLVYALVLADVILQYFHIRIASHYSNGRFSGSILLAALSFLRLFSIFPIFFLDKDSANLATAVVVVWFLGHLLYMYLLTEPRPSLADLRAPLWLYIAIRATLFTSMFFLITIGYRMTHDSGSFEFSQFSRNMGEAIAFLVIATMLYVPNRFYEFAREAIAHIESAGVGRYALRLAFFWILIILEIGTYDPRILDVALDNSPNPALVTKLDLSNSDLSRLDEIGRFTNLKELRLKANQLEKIPPEVLQLRSLEELVLSYNDIDSVPAELAELKKLKVLALNHNRLQALPRPVLDLSNLEELHLDQNQITHIPSEIARLSLLEKFDLRENQLRTLPAEIVNLPLREMKLHDNPLDQLDKDTRQKLRLRAGVYW